MASQVHTFMSSMSNELNNQSTQLRQNAAQQEELIHPTDTASQLSQLIPRMLPLILTRLCNITIQPATPSSQVSQTDQTPKQKYKQNQASHPDNLLNLNSIRQTSYTSHPRIVHPAWLKQRCSQSDQTSLSRPVNLGQPWKLVILIWEAAQVNSSKQGTNLTHPVDPEPN